MWRAEEDREKPDASGGDLGLQDGRGKAKSPRVAEVGRPECARLRTMEEERKPQLRALPVALGLALYWP
jgi:hypothetical protein